MASIRRPTLSVALATTVFLAFNPAVAGDEEPASIPLTDLGAGMYRDVQGGLYPGGENAIPGDHLAAGTQLAASIQPRDSDGVPSLAGRIAVVGLGMSNAQQVFSALDELLKEQWGEKAVFVNAAQGGRDAANWANNDHDAWPVTHERLGAAGLSAAQVQVVLNYHAVSHLRTPPSPWPETPGDLENFLVAIARNAKVHFPNTRLSFWATREFGGYATSQNNPEPYAYLSGFGVKWFIQRQIAGDPLLLHDGDAPGAAVAPWVGWGPYTWAAGLSPRGDGLVWERRDFQTDGLHLRRRARAKIAGAWARFLAESPLTAGLLKPAGERPPMVYMVFPEPNQAVRTRGPVALEAFADSLGGEISSVEFFVDGISVGRAEAPPFSLLWQPPASANYQVVALATDRLGRTAAAPAITASIRDPEGAGAFLAADGFESGDFQGGAGWNQASWFQSGAPGVRLDPAAAEGQWVARLTTGSSIARSTRVTLPEDTVLRFAWRGDLTAGTSLMVEVHDGAWKPIFSASGTIAAAFVRREVSLANFSATENFGLRFRVTGGDASFAEIDDIAFSAGPMPKPDLPAASIGVSRDGFCQVSWSAEKETTYRLWSSGDLIEWNPVYATTADERGTIAHEWPTLLPRLFFRVERLER
jgi:hypothetical protein